VQIKFDGKEYIISQDMWDAMTAHSVERGMTLDEYIAEAFTKLKEEQLKT
jgi:hypothetical protein